MLTEADVASHFLTWRTRRENGVVAGPVPDRLVTSFAEALSSRYRDQHLDDIRTIVDAFLGERAGLADWYAALLDCFEGKLVIQDGAPWLRVGALTEWRSRTGYVDPDALVALYLACTRHPSDDPAGIVAELPAWGSYLTILDHGLQTVLRRGLADIHVHLEACDPMPLLWLRIATGRLAVHHLEFFSDRRVKDLALDRRERERRERDRETLRQADVTRRDLCDQLGLRAFEREPLAGWMRHERCLLVAAWQVIVHLRDPGAAQALDRYLFAKNLFIRRHQQRPGLGPGLDRFRDFLDRGETLDEKRGKRTMPAIRYQRVRRMVHLATEAPDLRHLELRIAPPKRLVDWYDFFRLWRERFERKERSAGETVAVGFTVHFIRKSDRNPSDSCRMDFGKLRRELDRQTATLHLFRRRCPDLASYVTGIDVANIERGTPPEVFAPYLALLRGDETLAGNLDQDATRCWARLKARNEHRPPARLPRLGLTYHAGEDFHHPLEGLRAISGLLETVLKPGDRIGHGLAPGLDVPRFLKERGIGPIPRGVLLDDLVWFRREAIRLGRWVGTHQDGCDGAIEGLARSIYGAYDPSVRLLEHALGARFRMPHRPSNVGLSEEDRLVGLEAFDPQISKGRAKLADREERGALDRLDAGIMAAIQERLIRSIHGAGVMVEANPSSNLVTGTISRLTDHPFFRYLQVLDGQNIVTINTDDPGVFGTRIDVEFGLMFEAMTERGFSRSASLALLESARQLGRDYVFERARR